MVRSSPLSTPSNPHQRKRPTGKSRRSPFEFLSTHSPYSRKPSPFGANTSIQAKGVSRGVHNIARSILDQHVKARSSLEPIQRKGAKETLQGQFPNREATLQVPFDPLSTWYKPQPLWCHCVHSCNIIIPSNPSGREGQLGTLQVPFNPLSTW